MSGAFSPIRSRRREYFASADKGDPSAQIHPLGGLDELQTMTDPTGRDAPAASPETDSAAPAFAPVEDPADFLPALFDDFAEPAARADFTELAARARLRAASICGAVMNKKTTANARIFRIFFLPLHYIGRKTKAQGKSAAA
jgi:hypothetical protein